MYYKLVDMPSDEPVQFVGVDVRDWTWTLHGDAMYPTVGFVKVDEGDE